jgi:8-oxo-dGTP diphosphatase
MSPVVSSGVVILQDIGNAPHILLVKHRKGIDWGLPKGQVEPHEDHKMCAIRETLEETGFVIDISGEKMATLRSTKNQICRKEFHVYKGEILESLAPSHSDGIELSAWWPLARLPKLIPYQEKFIHDLHIEARRSSGLARNPRPGDGHLDQK